MNARGFVLSLNPPALLVSYLKSYIHKQPRKTQDRFLLCIPTKAAPSPRSKRSKVAFGPPGFPI